MSVMRQKPKHRHRAHRLAVAAAFVLACVAATGAGASERGRAERFYTKGLAELHAGHGDAAIALFQKAVDANPKDIHALYYRALGYGHVGRYSDAVVDLKVVVAAGDPSIDRDRLELGYALYRLGRYDEAAAELEIASKKGPSSGEATMLLGIVETRRGNQDAARAALAKVQAGDPQMAVGARYYEGLAAYRAGDEAAAAEHFKWVSENGGTSPFTHEASAFLDRMQGGGTRRYRLHAGTALEYDSNVALAPDNDAVAKNVLAISHKSGERAVFTAGGQYAIVATPTIHVALGYDFLQSLHFNEGLDKFDVQTHKFGVQSEYLHGPVTLGLAGNFEHALLDEDSLFSGETVLPWARYSEGDFGRTEVYYRGRRRDFVLAPYSPVRDSWNHAAGARQFFSLGSRDHNLVIGYRFDTDVAFGASGRAYDYDGHQFEAGIDWTFAHDITADALYAYRLENYTDAASASPSGQKRHDDEHQIIARIEKRVSPYVWVTGSYIYRRNLSDQTVFEYTRHIASLGVEVRY